MRDLILRIHHRRKKHQQRNTGKRGDAHAHHLREESIRFRPRLWTDAFVDFDGMQASKATVASQMAYRFNVIFATMLHVDLDS